MEKLKHKTKDDVTMWLRWGINISEAPGALLEAQMQIESDTLKHKLTWNNMEILGFCIFSSFFWNEQEQPKQWVCPVFFPSTCLVCWVSSFPSLHRARVSRPHRSRQSNAYPASAQAAAWWSSRRGTVEISRNSSRNRGPLSISNNASGATGAVTGCSTSSAGWGGVNEPDEYHMNSTWIAREYRTTFSLCPSFSILSFFF